MTWQSAGLLQWHQLCTTKNKIKIPWLQRPFVCHLQTWRKVHAIYETEENTNVSSDLHTSMQTDMVINTPRNSFTHLQTKESK